MLNIFRPIVVVMVALGSVLFVMHNSLLIASSPSLTTQDSDEKHSSRVDMDDIPRAVRKTIKKEAFGGRIIEVEKEYDDENLYYEAEVVIGSYIYDVAVNTKGVLLAKVMDRPLGKEHGDDEHGDDEDGDDDDDEHGDDEHGDDEHGDDEHGDGDDDDEDGDDDDEDGDDDDEDGDDDDEDGDGDGDGDGDDDDELRRAMAQLPKAVRKTLKRETRGGEIEELEKENEAGKVIYSAEVEYETEFGELVYEIEIAKNGLLLHKILESLENDSEDEDDEDDDDGEE